jgi:hypothetical protein
MRFVEGQRRYYEGAPCALRFIEARRPTKRRFGAEADATWKAFRGDFGTSARIDLLLRDADAQWPGAFGARTVYDLAAVAEDEAFGAAWLPLDDVALRCSRRATSAKSSAGLQSLHTSTPCTRSPQAATDRCPAVRVDRRSIAATRPRPRAAAATRTHHSKR